MGKGRSSSSSYMAIRARLLVIALELLSLERWRSVFALTLRKHKVIWRPFPNGGACEAERFLKLFTWTRFPCPWSAKGLVAFPVEFIKIPMPLNCPPTTVNIAVLLRASSRFQQHKYCLDHTNPTKRFHVRLDSACLKRSASSSIAIVSRKHFFPVWMKETKWRYPVVPLVGNGTASSIRATESI